MPAFQYSALDERGRQRKGLIEADTPRMARQLLRERGMSPLDIEEVASQERSRSRQWFRPRISPTELALITRQLATLVGSGLPLEEALGAVARQAERARLSGLLLAVRARVLEGHTLATALRDFPGVFPELYRATVAAGEQSGHLDVVFERLADYTEARQQMRQKVGLALFYPLLLTGVAILVVAGLLTYVVPQVVQVFSSLNQQLPALTRGLIALSDFLREYGGLLLIGLAAGAISWVYALRRVSVKRRVHQTLLKLPLIARLIRGANTARFARAYTLDSNGLRAAAQRTS